MSTEQITIVACPVCEQFHKKDYQGECRNNAERFTGIKDAAKKLGTRENNILKLDRNNIREIEPMNIGQILYEEFTKNESDLNLSKLHAQFTHNDACEYIFFIGDPNETESKADHLKEFKDQGFSELFILIIQKAQEDGFEWLNFYI